MYSGKHTQDPAPFLSLQTAFVPQGFGKHGFICSDGGGRGSERKSRNIWRRNTTGLVPSAKMHLWNGLPE
jgi:hypothetical protein